MALKAAQAASSARLRRDLNAWLLQLDGAGEVAAVDAHLVGRIGRVCSLQEWALRAPTPR
jgi:hypothetical protein